MERKSERGLLPHFNFILQPEFSLSGLVLASDALRIANQNSGQTVFTWAFTSETGESVRASNGMWFSVDHAMDQMPKAEVYLLFEGNLPTQHNSRKLLGKLRTAARFEAFFGAVDTGAFALAQAGLIGSEKSPEIVLHWEAVPAFVERFPAARPLNQLFYRKDKRVHCAGGVATLDMMLDLISHFKGEAMANEVANALVHTRREASVEQRRDGLFESEKNPLSGKIVRLMEKHLDFPLSLAELAIQLGIPQRTLSHVSQQAFGESPMRLYLRIRLQAARNFLFYEEISAKDVSTSCGFSYPCVFSRAFRAQFGLTPREFRAKLRASQNLAVRPEIRRLLSQYKN